MAGGSGVTHRSDPSRAASGRSAQPSRDDRRTFTSVRYTGGRGAASGLRLASGPFRGARAPLLQPGPTDQAGARRCARVLRRTPDRTQPPAVVSGGVDRCYWRPRRTGERSHPARRLRRAHADARPERSTPSAAASNRVRVGPGAPRSARRRGNDHWPAHQRTRRKRRVDIVRELDVARELDVDRSIDSVGVHIVTGGGHAPSPRQPTIGITAEPLRDRPPIGRGQSFNDSARRSLTTDARRVSARSSWALRLGGGCQPNVGQHDVSHHTDHDGAVGLEQHDVEY